MAVSQRDVTFSLDDYLADLLRGTPEQIGRRVLECVTVDLYRQHLISRGRAAEALGLNFEGISAIVQCGKIPHFDWEEEDIAMELRKIDRP
jgi:predicted HTH domain antitoxin